MIADGHYCGRTLPPHYRSPKPAVQAALAGGLTAPRAARSPQHAASYAASKTETPRLKIASFDPSPSGKTRL